MKPAKTWLQTCVDDDIIVVDVIEEERNCMWGLNEQDYATLRYIARKRLEKRLQKLHYKPRYRKL